jgi:hypothetical protein
MLTVADLELPSVSLPKSCLWLAVYTWIAPLM